MTDTPADRPVFSLRTVTAVAAAMMHYRQEKNLMPLGEPPAEVRVALMGEARFVLRGAEVCLIIDAQAALRALQSEMPLRADRDWLSRLLTMRALQGRKSRWLGRKASTN